MSAMILEVQLDGNACAELCGCNIKLWVGEGLPVYEGDIEGMSQVYPAQFNALLKRGVIKKLA